MERQDRHLGGRAVGHAAGDRAFSHRVVEGGRVVAAPPVRRRPLLHGGLPHRAPHQRDGDRVVGIGRRQVSVLAPLSHGEHVGVFQVAAARQEPEGVRESLRPPGERRLAKTLEHGTRRGDRRKRGLRHAAAGQGAVVREGRGGIDRAVRVDAQGVPARIAEIELHAGLTVGAAANGLEVVERDAELARPIGGAIDRGEDLGGRGEEAVVRRLRAPPPVRPHQVLGLRAPPSRVLGQERELRQIPARDDRRQRDVETQPREKSHAVHGLLERAGAADRVVGLGPRPVHGNLELHELAREGIEARPTRAAKEGGVGQDDQLAGALFRDQPDQVVDVGPQERLPTRHVETLDPELKGLGDHAPQLRPGHPGRLAGAGIDETVSAGEIAGVVRVEPELPQPLGRGMGRSPFVGLPRERLE